MSATQRKNAADLKEGRIKSKERRNERTKERKKTTNRYFHNRHTKIINKTLIESKVSGEKINKEINERHEHVWLCGELRFKESFENINVLL